MFKPHFLVISIGNPLPKYASLHSAGHFAINGLAKLLSPMRDGDRFTKESMGKQSCLTFRTPKYTLVLSPTLMNVSGGFVSRAWKCMLERHDPASLSLVILHDELEKPLGDVRLVGWDKSPRGHNGIKSVKKSVSEDKYPESPLARIAIGIGRPVERDADSVSEYVLRQIKAEERVVLEEQVPSKVLMRLQELEDEWKAELE